MALRFGPLSLLVLLPACGDMLHLDGSAMTRDVTVELPEPEAHPAEVALGKAPRTQSERPTAKLGRLPPETILRVVRSGWGKFRLCYAAGLTPCPNLQGRVSLEFVIGYDGSVIRARVNDSDLNADITRCVLKALYGLTFPRPVGGPVRVSYPVVFTPGG